MRLTSPTSNGRPPRRWPLHELAFAVNDHLRQVFSDIGLELIDFKLEFGKEDASGTLRLADQFTPDGSRLWDRETGEPMDKDCFRQDLGGVEEAYEEVFRQLKEYFEGEGMNMKAGFIFYKESVFDSGWKTHWPPRCARMDSRR